MPKAMFWVAAAFADGVSASSQQERYVSSTDQLVVELFVDDLDRSIAFYRDLGFPFVRRDETIADPDGFGVRFATRLDDLTAR